MNFKGGHFEMTFYCELRCGVCVAMLFAILRIEDPCYKVFAGKNNYGLLIRSDGKLVLVYVAGC